MMKSFIIFTAVSGFILVVVFGVNFPLKFVSAAPVTVSAVVFGVCGNALVEFGEQCDGGNLNGQSCTSLGYESGVLSCNLNCTFNVSACVPISSPGPRGGGQIISYIFPPATGAIFSGTAFPSAEVVLLKNAQFAASATADTLGAFNINLASISPGNYTFSLYAKNVSGERTDMVSFLVNVTGGAVTSIKGIILGLPAKTPVMKPEKLTGAADLSGDDSVNLIDFSILVYWFERSNYPSGVDLNMDGVVDMIDLSIIAYYWTG